jgi:thioredoxin reductase (NADPH)
MASGKWDCDCAVIGGGPGGLVSALYLRRFRREAILINHGRPRASWIPETHNLIGFYKGISGHALLLRLARQVRDLEAEKINGRASVKKIKSGFQINVGGRTLNARKVILATGITDNQPNLPNLNELREKGVLRYCSICDAYEYRDQPIIVLAQDAAGFQKAFFLCHYSDRITVVAVNGYEPPPRLIHEMKKYGTRFRRGPVRCIETSPNNPGVWVHLEEGRPLFARVAYVELGSTVNDEGFKNLRNLSRTKEGLLISTTEQRLSVPGLFAVGDCVNVLAQISVAAGQAAVAATTVHNDLLKES